MYHPRIPRKTSPSFGQTRIIQEPTPVKKYAPLSNVVQRAQQDPSSVTGDEWQQLQLAIGYRATKGLRSGEKTDWKPKFKGISALYAEQAGQKLPVQAKLVIGQPNDKYEQEADRVAVEVVQQINTPTFIQLTSESLQRQPETEEQLQTKPETITIRRSPAPKLQRKAVAGGEASTDLTTAINSARGSGQPLDTKLQASMGQAMGADFSRVRIHNDAKSNKLNQSIQAKAFTTGQDVFFRQGEYQPRSKKGQKLIAHELTHVVQQGETNKNTSIQRTIEPRKSPDLHERLSEVNDEKLKQIYNAAWKYLWESETARFIYNTVDKSEHHIFINVGYKGDSFADVEEVNWNIFDSYAQIKNKTNKEFEGVNQDNLIGISSSATTLIHELGHVKQRIETSKAEGKDQWSRNIDNMIESTYNEIKNYESFKEDKYLNFKHKDNIHSSLPIERDNVTRHERPVQEELNDQIRYDYSKTTTLDYLTADHFPEETAKRIKEITEAEKFKELVIKSEKIYKGDLPENITDKWDATVWFEKVEEFLAQYKKELSSQLGSSPKQQYMYKQVQKLPEKIGKINKVLKEINDKNRFNDKAQSPPEWK